MARPRARPLTRKVRPSASLRNQLNDMKRATNKMKENGDKREIMKRVTNKMKENAEKREIMQRFIRNGFPQPRKQNPNKV
jgi:hypothetical protein